MVSVSVSFVSANAEKTTELVSSKSTDDVEEMLYTYDDEYRIVKICSSDNLEPQYNTARVFTYNENNQCVMEQLYQDMQMLGTWDVEQMNYNSRIEYIWNEEGRLVERQNYNNFGSGDEPEFTLGGVIVYEYNEDGTMKSQNIYWDAEKTMLGQKIEYIYNEAGQLTRREDSMPDWGSDELMLIAATDYTYLENGLRSQESIWYGDGTGNLILDSNVNFVYDEEGNLQQKSVVTATGAVRERYDFKFFDKENQPAPAEEIAYPINMEDDIQNFLFEHFQTLVPSSYDTYALSMSTNELEFYATYEFTYKKNSGVNGISVDGNAFGLRGLSKDSIKFGGIGNDRVRIYTLSGQMVMDTNAVNGNVNISSLPAGQYCVYTLKGSVKISK